ncbi:hypothetical protein HYN80_09415 [Vibrio parahaemolyticus]|nr:hypothetical protein [Vibrio parahaemolyticus]ELB2065214.1 hypothetical protein [Vibrio parahaemolyticus]ELB2113994.1 hypothetical protein [Vibrio parahaemolyticus]MBM5172751.1 hypothetical protein [Vibrio parahaemolyticus]MBM5187767.1 hypothetical protein [Vibrio parahaemolyticus]
MKEQLHSLTFMLRKDHGDPILQYSCDSISNFISQFSNLVNDYATKNDCAFYSLYKKTTCILFDRRLNSIEQFNEILQSSIQFGFSTKVIIDVNSYIQIYSLNPHILSCVNSLHLYSLEDNVDAWVNAFEVSLLFNSTVTFVGKPTYFLHNKLLTLTHLKMNNLRITAVKETSEKCNGTLVIDELGLVKSLSLNNSSNYKISNLFNMIKAEAD